MKRLLVTFFVLLSSIALSQDITNHAVPIGGGPGAVGWKVAGPCAAGQALVWAGTTSDPTCISVSGSGSTPGGSNLNVQYNNAGTFGGLTDTQLTARINAATASLPGALPAWPNTTTTWFRGDGTYTTIPFTAVTGSVSLAQLPLMPPGGRLVLTNAACGTIRPIQLLDVAIANVACYVPYNSSVVPINGVNKTFATLQLQITATHNTAGNLYDIWAVTSGGNAAICTGGAGWTTNNPGVRSVAIAKSGALWTNSGTVANCWNNNSDLGSFTAGQATYLGTIYANVDGGSQWLIGPNAATNGTNNILGLYNAYNRVRVTAIERELTSNWTYSTATWRPQNNSTSNRIWVVDGLGESLVEANLVMTYDAGTANANGGTTAICWDCTTPGVVNQIANQAATKNTSTGSTMPSFGTFPQLAFVGNTTLGLHYYQALEIGGGGDFTEWFGNGFSGLIISLDN